jgi:hypothetical protein
MQAVVFMAGFAAAWWVAGVVGGHQFIGLTAIGPLISAVMILVARTRLKGEAPLDAAERKHRSRTVGWAAGLEAVAIVVAVNLLNRNNLGAYLFPAIAVIVGLHFLPLAKLLPVKIYYLSAALLVAVGVAGLAVNAADRPFVVGVSSAIVLWVTCLGRLARTPAPSPAA